MAQSLAGYIRQHLDEIETEIWNGKRLEEIVSAINAAGYPNVTVRAFSNYLSRARRAYREKQKKRQGEEGKPPASVPAADIPAEEEPKPSRQKPVITTTADNPLKKPAGFEWPGTLSDEELF